MRIQGSFRLNRRRGFALPELAAIVFVATVGCALLVVAMSDVRRQAGLGRDIANLRQIGQWTGMYAADNDDRYWTFSWEAGNMSSQWPDLRNPGFAREAAAFQAVDIMRRRSGRGSGVTMIGVHRNWVPHFWYSYLALVDYLDRDLPDDGVFVSNADVFRKLWADDPLAFDQGAFLPFQPSPNAGNMRWPYSSSYWLPTAFFDGGTEGNRVSMSSPRGISMPNVPVLEGQRRSQVVFPSQKMHLSDTESRHFGQNYFSLVEAARLPFLMADSSVQIHLSGSADVGWDPNRPAQQGGVRMRYSPRTWQAPAFSASGSDEVRGRFFLTRDGLAGIDFDGRGPKKGHTESTSDLDEAEGASFEEAIISP